MNVIFDEEGLRRAITRLAHEVAEKCEDVVFLGVKRGGEIVAKRVCAVYSALSGGSAPCAGLDVGMTRDDLVSSFFVPDATPNSPDFSVDGRTVVLCDDVLHTGRTVAAAIEAIFRLGRPERIRLLVLVDRGGREVPVGADFVGKNVPTSRREYVRVRFKELDGEDELSLTEAVK